MVPLEFDLPMFHNPETAIFGKGSDPKRKENTIKRVMQKGFSQPRGGSLAQNT